jgi:hypothetical protein
MATSSKSAKTTKTSTAAKKPADKKAPAKKPAAKAAPVKKTAAPKKAAPAKTPEAKKAPVKKAAPEKKPAAKAPAVKKPAAKAAPVKAVPAKTVSETKPAPAKTIAAPAEELTVKFRNLFEAYAQGKLPFAHGYIVSSFFNEGSAYSIYEIVSYAGVKEIFLTETGLQFVTGGKKLYVLVEHDTYALKYQEPTSRKEGERIPKRFSELEIITAKNQTKIMVAKEANESYGSFTILRPQGINFSVVFYERPDVHEILGAFFQESLNKQRKVPQSDARAAAALITKTVEKTMAFKGEFE